MNGLEALYRMIYNGYVHSECKELKIIEKDLKALHILKDRLSFDLLRDFDEEDEPYWIDATGGTNITKEEYELLKEVFYE